MNGYCVRLVVEFYYANGSSIGKNGFWCCSYDTNYSVVTIVILVMVVRNGYLILVLVYKYPLVMVCIINNGFQ